MDTRNRWTLCMVLGLTGTGANATAGDGAVPPAPELPDAIPAFPGAWGGGMFTTGGRGGKVIEVTNLNDSGPGSLRAAVGEKGARIVVFRVSGVIRLERMLDIDDPDITIAGQTAPGDGICVAHAATNINTHNVIIRHIRFRRGVPEGGQGDDCLGGNPEGQVIVDHCSTSWGMDENVSIYRYMRPLPGGGRKKEPTKNVTIQWTISSEALDARNHAFGGTWGGEDATFHHNLFACNTGRNPSIGMSGEFDYRNNVIFNWRHRTMDGGDETSRVNVINNYYRPGPATRSGRLQYRIARAEKRNMFSPGQPKRPGKWYVAGNIVHGNEKVTTDNWAGGVQIDRGTKEDLAHARAGKPFEGWPINQQSAQEACEAVLAKAGATLPKRDAIDHRVVEAVRTGQVTYKKGIITDPEQVGGYPEYATGKVPADTDHDGMPDEWEKKHGLDPEGPSDNRTDTDKDGYTNIEEYLNATDPRKFIDYKNLKNNVDTMS